MIPFEKETIGVLLLNLGGPDSPRAVRPFLYNLFSDRKIIKLGPPFLQKPLAWFISSLRSKKTEKMYSRIGGRSPILDITKSQAESLEKVLNKNSELRTQKSEQEFRVYVGMRYWHPLIEEVVPEIYRDGIKKLVAVSMYPHYSNATTGSSISKLQEVLLGYPIEVLYITSWFNHPTFIEALVDVIKKGLESFAITSESETRDSELNILVLFSAHNLPESLIRAGDPYVNQIQRTIGEIKKKMNIECHLSYQSRSGPVKWLKPSTEEMIKRCAEAGYKKILLVPISFVSDHIETLFEVDILYKSMAERFGIVLKRTDSLNINPLFIEALKDLVMKRLTKEYWI